MPIRFEGVRWFHSGRFQNGTHDVTIAGPEAVVRGGVLLDGFVDAHVHVTLSDAAAMARGGISSALDLGAPMHDAFTERPPVRMQWAGPLLTARDGYPTRSWGAGGYGWEIASESEAREAVSVLAARGARWVKIAIEPSAGPALADEVLASLTGAAARAGMRTVAHALGAEAVMRAMEARVDALAHTPIEPLPDSVVAALGAHAVIVMSTVRAFGASRVARNNLAELARAGCRVVYGTDLGNGAIRPGIDVAELRIIADALGSEDAAIASATAHDVCGEPLSDDVVWVERWRSLDDLAGPKRVWIGGAEVR